MQVFFINEYNEKEIFKNSVLKADNFFTRFKGLMGKKYLDENEGLLIYPCKQIHMFFMKIPIDVIYCDKDYNVLHITRNIQPWKIDKFIKNCYYVLEIKANTIPINTTLKKLEFV